MRSTNNCWWSNKICGVKKDFGWVKKNFLLGSNNFFLVGSKQNLVGSKNLAGSKKKVFVEVQFFFVGFKKKNR